MTRSAAYFLLAIAATLSGCASNPFHQTTIDLASVMAAPDTYHGRTLKVRGYLTFDFEGTAMYPSKEVCLAGKLEMGIWLDVLPQRFPISYERCGLGWAVGAYERPGKYGSGHFGGWTGELESVSSFGQESNDFKPAR